MPDDNIVDADVVDEKDHVDDVPPPAPSTDLAVVGSAGAIIRAEHPREILGKAKEIATALGELIESAGLSVALDRRNPDRKHVEVGGWQAAGTLLGALGGQPLHSETVWTRRVTDEDGRLQRTRYTATVKRYHSKKDGGGLKSETTYDVDGFDWEARVDIKTPDGRVVGTAEAMVSRAEETWSRRDDYAVRSMAETRAESRAYRKAIGWIVHIAGYNPTPAEEMGHTPGADTSTPASDAPSPMREVTAGEAAQLRTAMAYVLGCEEDSAAISHVLERVSAKCGGVVPWVALQAIGILAGAVKAARAASEPQSDVTPPQTETLLGDAGDASPPPGGDAPAPDAHDYPAGAVRVSGVHDIPVGSDGPSVIVDDARKICTCSGGFDAVERLPLGDRANRTDDKCPIFNHGIPF